MIQAVLRVIPLSELVGGQTKCIRAQGQLSIYSQGVRADSQARFLASIPPEAQSAFSPPRFSCDEEHSVIWRPIRVTSSSL